MSQASNDPPVPLDWALNQSPHSGGARQLVLTDASWQTVVSFLYRRGLHVFPIPAGDDPGEIPSYGVGVPQWAFDLAQRDIEAERRDRDEERDMDGGLYS